MCEPRFTTLSVTTTSRAMISGPSTRLDGQIVRVSRPGSADDIIV
jgi:hypothetical protein